ncbi:MAG: transketolase [Candidatus Rickettsia vulgarisii]
MPKNSQEYLKLSNCIRVLASDAIEKAKSGHPGMVLGMADVMTILAFNFLKFNPSNPTWFNRDRLVLSAGHGSMLLYSFYYLANYKDFHLEDLKQFRTLHSKTPGHPEYEAYEAIETTTGPLGQGFANSVGIAIAQKKYQQKLGKSISDNKVYCIVGDGCLMEGISYEAASIAGHLSLNNLIVLFDDNKISIDGPTNLAVSEDHLLKFKALGWNTETIDGHDFEQITKALTNAQSSDKPYFISCRTLIAKGCTNKVNSANAHGSPLGREEIKLLKEHIGFKDEEFYIPDDLKNIWFDAWLKNKEDYDHWNNEFNNLTIEQKNYLNKPDINSEFLDNIPLATSDEATKVSSGKIMQELAKQSDKIIFGSADLAPSNNIKNSFSKIITKDDFSGNYIHYGVREHAMAAIMNGLALSGFLPVGATFLVFSDYMKPAIRLSALMQQQVIYILTHDSIGLGEDGPTHQPIEHLASLRALPNISLLRPADYIETKEAWKIVLANKTTPAILALTRQNLPQISKEGNQEKGGYIVAEDENSDITIFASGSEVSIALQTKEILNNRSLKVTVVSILSFELFFQQDPEYIHNILSNSKLKFSIEAASSFGWHRIIGEDGMFFGMDQFGASAPANDLYSYFGITASTIAKKILERMSL